MLWQKSISWFKFLLSVPAHEGERMRANGNPHNRSQPPLTGSSGGSRYQKGILVCSRARRRKGKAIPGLYSLARGCLPPEDALHSLKDTHSGWPTPTPTSLNRSPSGPPSLRASLQQNGHRRFAVLKHICWKPVFCILCFCKPVETPSSWEVEPIQVHQLSISPIFYLERKFTVENHIELLLGDIGRSNYYYLLGPAQGRILVEAFEEESCWSRPW